MKNTVKILIAGFLILSSATVHGAGTLINSKPLRDAVTVEGIRDHLEVFQAIAEQNGGNRFSGSTGHLASMEYAQTLLADAGYEVSVQEFSFPFFQQINPPELEIVSPLFTSYLAGNDILVTAFSGSGEVMAEVVPVDVQVPATGVAMTSGCELNDFLVNGSSIVEDKIALIQRGTCTFQVKAQNAIAAGAVGVVFFNQGTPGRTGLLDSTTAAPITIPAIGSTYGVGEDIVELYRSSPPVTLRMKTDTVSEIIASVNLIADLPGGDSSQKLVLVSGLSGPLDNPGINFPGSGAAALLEIALQLPEIVTPRKKIRFAFLTFTQGQGAVFYRNSLSQPEWESHAGFLAVDAIGSRNFVRLVHDGDDSSGMNVTPPPNGSGLMESALLEWFRNAGVPTRPTGDNIGGIQLFSLFRQPFKPIAAISTGGTALKTELEAEIFGGTAGLAHDPFVAINDLTSVDFEVLGQMKDALAHAIYTLSRTKAAIFDGENLKPGKRDYTLPNEGTCGDDLATCGLNLN